MTNFARLGWYATADAARRVYVEASLSEVTPLHNPGIWQVGSTPTGSSKLTHSSSTCWPESFDIDTPHQSGGQTSEEETVRYLQGYDEESVLPSERRATSWMRIPLSAPAGGGPCD